MGLQGSAAIAGFAEWKPERKPTRPPRFDLEQWSILAREALEDAGINPDLVDGIVMSRITESDMFAPSTVAEYLGFKVNFAEYVDLGGATGAGMIWRAAAAVELGIADVVVCAIPGSPIPVPPPVDVVMFGASSNNDGSPQAEFDIPYGQLGQNSLFALIANRYAAQFGYDPTALAKIAADQRTNACATPDAIFYGIPQTIQDVLASPMISDPLHLLEIVMPVAGGNAVVVTSVDTARKYGKHRPVRITGFGERLTNKSPSYAEDLARSPMREAADSAFAMAGVSRADIDTVSAYDCYTITVLMTLEDAGFCEKGTAADFIHTHDLTYRGDFPVNTHGGQLSFGQAGLAGGMSHICDGARQIMGRSTAQVPNCERAFVSGTGGIMSEQVALILEGD